MWSLVNLQSETVYFVNKNVLTIGRDDNDICLTDDQSISRKHAVLTIQNDKLTIKDTNSRYGTYLNQQNTMSFKATHKLAPNVEHEVKVGDRIRLGRFNNIFEVEYRQYKIVKSSLGTDENRKLEKILSKIGVKVSEEFDESITHLTTSKRTDLTHKLTTALAMYLPVVTIEFWESVLLSFENNNQFPDYKNYIPTIKDRSLTFPARISLDLNPHRKVLFSGKTFVFISRNQENEYKKIIHAAGGKSTNLNDDKFTTQQFLQGNMIVIQPRNDEKISSQSHRNSKSFQSITNAFKTYKLRLIPEAEIAKAVLYVNTQKWCNPKESTLSLVNPTQTILNTQNNGILCPASSTIDNMNTITSLDLNYESQKENIDESNTFESIPETEHYQEVISEIPTIETQPSIDLPQTQYVQTQNQEVSQNQSEQIDDNPNVLIEPKQEPLTNESDFFSFAKPPKPVNKNKRKQNLSSFDVSILEESQQAKKPRNSEEMPSTSTSFFTKPATQSTQSSQRLNRNKRFANEVSNDNPAGLFDFGEVSIPKKRRVNKTSSSTSTEVNVMSRNEQTLTPTMTISKLLSNEEIRSFYLENSNDSGSWLSKKMSKINLEDVNISIKKEPLDSDEIDTKSNLTTTTSAFEIINGSTICPSEKKGKQFKKKINFKKQTQVIPMTLVCIDSNSFASRGVDF